MEMKPSSIDLAERLESLKAGITGAIAATLGFTLANLVYGLLLRYGIGVPYPQMFTISSWHGWGSGAIALLSGFLFGVTYRYVIRQDQNPHLKSGVVLAFALVRGLARIDAMDWALPEVISLVLPIGEGVMLFAIAQVVLDQAMHKGLIKSFATRS